MSQSPEKRDKPMDEDRSDHDPRPRHFFGPKSHGAAAPTAATSAVTTATAADGAMQTSTSADAPDLNPTFEPSTLRIMAPLGKLVDSNIRKRQVIFEHTKGGDTRVALLAYTAPVSDIKVTFPKFGSIKSRLTPIAAAQIPYFAFADLPGFAAARADPPASNLAAADKTLPGYHCYELPPSDTPRDSAYLLAVYEAWRAKMYHYIDVELKGQSGSSATRAIVSHAYELTVVQRTAYFNVSWPSDAPDISNRSFKFVAPRKDDANKKRSDKDTRIRDAVLEQSTGDGNPVSSSRKNASKELDATWLKRGPNSPPFLLTLGFTANSDRVALNALIQQLRIHLNGKAQVLDLWLVYNVTSREREGVMNTQQTFATNGEYFMLIALTQDNAPASMPAAVCSTLPGYIHLDNTTYTLRYRDRRDFCQVCKPTVENFHDRDGCPKLDCFHCNRKGIHFPNRCPQLLTKDKKKATGTKAAPAPMAVHLDALEPTPLDDGRRLQDNGYHGDDVEMPLDADGADEREPGQVE